MGDTEIITCMIYAERKKVKKGRTAEELCFSPSWHKLRLGIITFGQHQRVLKYTLYMEKIHAHASTSTYISFQLHKKMLWLNFTNGPFS